MIKQPVVELVLMQVPQHSHHLFKDSMTKVHLVEFIVATANGMATVIKLATVNEKNAMSVHRPNITEKPNVKIGTNQVAPIEGSDKSPLCEGQSRGPF